LECDNDYYQANGYLVTLDNTTCTLQDGPNDNLGTATIAGGTVVINQPGGGVYGQLTVNAKTLQFGGTLAVSIAGQFAGQNPGPSDKLNVTGTTVLGGTASLTVLVDNAPPNNGSLWVIIQDGAGNNIQGNFQMPINTSPQTNLNAAVNPNDNTQYILGF
jgi:hypothetical protein